MVEEMYNKEVGDVEIDFNFLSEYAQKASKTDAKASQDLCHATTSKETEHCRTGQPFEPNSDIVHGVEMVGSDTNPTFQNLMRAEPENGYGIGQLETESLSLGLQGGSLPVADETSPNFVTMRGNDVYTVTAASTGIQTPGFDYGFWKSAA
ncbi:unnamed protein product [Fraxinus pennsylvanica]|uniref:Uncharacterized protein n=1 Tax=Fraxinus pennsylvanica TaxID=56036 RepID=A0AAD2DW71_9LAMI|nr:unnamed protein product [Fraxinus pennsylvanica]